MTDGYTRMQISEYQGRASQSVFEAGRVIHDGVVGTFEAHNSWQDHHEFLIRHSKMGDTRNFKALDFACGPGRNIRLFSDRFRQIDGVDLSELNLSNAKIYTSDLENPPVLYHCNGTDLENIPSETYDIIISTIAFQHICCHSIRLRYLQEFNRVLKRGGFLCIQMGYGSVYPKDTRTSRYHQDKHDAPSTNGYYDTQVTDPSQLEDDLTKVGFRDFEYNIRPPGPGDTTHPNWIYWSAMKQ